MRRHLTAEHSGHPDISVRLTRIRLRTRRGEIPQEDHPQARDHALQIDAQDQRSTIVSTPIAQKRSLRRTWSPSQLAGRLTCLGAYTRHRLTLSLLLCIAGGLEQYSHRHQRPRQRSFLAASLHSQRNFLVQLLRYRQRQLFQGNHLLEQGLLFGLRVHSGTRRLREV